MKNLREFIRLREEARARRDFATADRLRDQLSAAGVEIEDGPEGPKVKKLSDFDASKLAEIAP